MIRTHGLAGIGLLCVVSGVWSCDRSAALPERNDDPQASLQVTKTAPETPSRRQINPQLLRRFRPKPSDVQDVAITDEMVDLGRALWFDKRLSRAGDISCNTCHDLSNYGQDGTPTSRGHEGAMGRRNTPTVYNVAEHFAMFWDGRRQTVEDQATDPLLNPSEMAMTVPLLITRLKSIPGYKKMFRAAFPGDRKPLSKRNVGRALGAFERGLVTRSRWDVYLAGGDEALTDQELEGLGAFLDLGCVGCHTGPQMGAKMFQRVGLAHPWPNQSDRGRFELTQAHTDNMVFKVPTLLNVGETAPYFHDGSVASLEEAVRDMGIHQLDIELSDKQIADMVAFLKALTGEISAEYIRAPALPGGKLALK